MAYEILENNGVDITNLDGAAFNKLSTADRSGVISGYMEECRMYADGNKVILSTGCMVVEGIRIKITEDEVFTMQSSPSASTDYELTAEVKRLSADPVFTVDFIIRPSPTPVIPAADILKEAGTVYFTVGGFTHAASGNVLNAERTAQLLEPQTIDLSDYYKKTETYSRAELESILDSELGGGAPELLWSGNLTLYPDDKETITAALLYPDLFQEPGLFALKIMVPPDCSQDITPFIKTILIDTEDSGSGETTFSGVSIGYTVQGFGGMLAWGAISFINATGSVTFWDGWWYDFTDLIDPIDPLHPNILEEIRLLSVHRISRTVID